MAEGYVNVSIKLSDFRRFFDGLGITNREIVKKARLVVLNEIRVSKNRLKKLASGQSVPGSSRPVQSRTGSLASSVDGSVNQVDNVIYATVGYDGNRAKPQRSDKWARNRTAAAANTLTGQTTMPIKPRPDNKSGLLTFPVRGKTPGFGAKGDNQLHTLIRKLSRTYFLIWGKHAVMGRKRHSKTRELTFIFARAPQVTIPKYIDLNDELIQLTNRIQTKLESIQVDVT